MGIGLGFGLVIGVRAATAGSTVVFLVLVAGFVLTAFVCPAAARPVLAILAAGCVAGWAGALIRLEQDDHFRSNDLPSSFTATILSDPTSSVSGSFAAASWRDDRDGLHEITMTLPLGADVGRGDSIRVWGRVNSNADGPDFYTHTAVVMERAGQLELTRRAIRDRTKALMVRRVSGSPGSLTLGLLIGEDQGLSSVERSDLRRSGLSHITAVSGWNVSVIIVSVGALFRALGARRWRWLAVQLLLVTGYVWIVGLEPPIQRAAIMGSVALIALQLGRPSHLLTSLTITAGGMSTWDPSLLNSLSFWLTFLSMLGLAMGARITSNMSGWRSVIVAPSIATAASGIATAPLLAATFGTLSFTTVPANVMAGPLVPLATFSGIAVVASSWVAPVAQVFGWMTWILSSAVLWVATFFAGMPGAQITFAPLQPAWAMTIYGGLAILALPLVPEGRAMIRQQEDWMGSEPRATALVAAIAIGVLSIGILAMLMGFE